MVAVQGPDYHEPPLITHSFIQNKVHDHKRNATAQNTVQPQYNENLLNL
jgi:hypothetical protein